MRIVPLIALTLGLVSGAALAQPAGAAKFDSFDADGDGAVSEAEFGEGFAESGLLEGWDADRDGVLDDDEFSGALLGRADADRDGALGEEEFAALGNSWPLGEGARTFGDLDADADGAVDAEEFRTGLVDDEGLFGMLDDDDDRLLSEEELAAGIFLQRDANRDRALDANEFDSAVGALR